jgi:hypothetical protein
MVAGSLGLVAFCWWYRTQDTTPDIGSWNPFSRALYALLDSSHDFIQWVVPSYFEPGVTTLRHHPAKTVVFLGAFAAIFWGAGRLLDVSRSLSFRAWRGSMPSLLNITRPFEPRGNWWSGLARRVRTSRFSQWLERWTTRALPVAIIAGLSAAILVTALSWLVPPFSVALNPMAPEATEVRDAAPRYITFDTTHSLQSTPLILVRGEKYRITVVKHSGWKDGAFHATPAGANERSAAQEWLGWRRRHPEAEWFQLLGSVGPEPEAAFPIGFETVIRAERTDRLYLFVNDVFGLFHNNQGTTEIRVECLTAVR